MTLPADAAKLDAAAAADADPLAVERGRLRLVAGMGTPGSYAVAVVALLLGWVLSRNHSLPVVAAWVAMMVLTVAARGLYCKWLLEHIDTLTDLAQPRRVLTAIALATGATMGSSILVFGFDGTQEERVLLSTLTLAYGAAASAASGAHPQALLAWVLAAVPQVVVFWLLVGTSEAQLLALVLCLTSVIVLIFGLQISRMVTKGVLIRQENIGLLKQLRLERDQATLARQAAEAANLAKSRFLAATSHDLRQPLHALSLFGSTLTLHVKEGPVRQLSDQINNAIKILDRLFVDLLDLSKLDAGAVVPSETDFSLRRIFAALAAEFRSQFEARGLALSTADGDAWVRTDPALLERVLRNLVSNALRYTVKGGARVVAIVDGDSVRIEVSDTGIGIAPANVPRIFDEYYQVHNPGRRREYGVGLGLAIVRRLADLLHLKIEVESELDKGSLFRLVVPAARTRLQTAYAPGVEPPFAALGLRVWLVEDDELVATAMDRILAAWGCTMRVCRTRADLQRLHAQTGVWPDVVVLDDMLGESESGLALAQALEPEIGNSRILMVSGNTDPHRLAEISNCGFTLLVKPVDPLALHARLREIGNLAA